MTIKRCASLFVGGLLIVILIFMMFGLVLLGPQSCEWILPKESFEDKDVDFLISKLQSWRVRERDRAMWHFIDKTQERDKIIAALTDTLLNDSHEEVRVIAAGTLSVLTPPAIEAVPALREALNLPRKDRGKPIPWYMVLDVSPLPVAAEEALEKIGTPEALKAIE